MFVTPAPNSYVEILILKVMILGHEPLAGEKTMRVENSGMELMTLQKKPEEAPLPLPPHEITVIIQHSVWKRTLNRYSTYLALVLNFPHSEL